MSWWRWLRARHDSPAVDDTRWIVLDVEASGLDASRDRLLAIAALAVAVDDRQRPRIALADSFEVVLAQPADTAPDKANILLHGIGVGAQSAGVAATAALQAFTRFVARSPLVAFHAAFDRTLIERGIGAAGLPRLANPWLDLEPLAAVLHPQVRARALDDWLAHFRIPCARRHQAAADTLATAELLLHLWPTLASQVGTPRIAAVRALAASRRWLVR
ncbi:MAG TPA: 3'-5' exonuclease [Burkholderiaceae bacterium]